MVRQRLYRPSCKSTRKERRRIRRGRSWQLPLCYRAELGTFHNKHAAERKRSELQSRFSSVLKEVDVVSPDSADKRYRVMSGLMDRQDADSACASLKRDHQTCEVVKADQQQS